MKFTVSWLREFVACDLPPQQLADHLTMLGLEVDAVEPTFPWLDGVVVAAITDVAPHPNADRLVVCQADAGGETLQVVCGAPNAKAGMLTALALPGAELPGGLVINKAKIRGQHSSGMFCSWRDLGLGDDHAGIVALDDGAAVGTTIRDLFALNDTAIEIDLTPNRPDCTSVIGIGREVAAVTQSTLQIPAYAQVEPVAEDLPFTVRVEDQQGCPRYAARVVRGIKVQPSPAWLRHRLLAVGLRPINNVVDVTNYVMLEYGQPMHAFDLHQLAGHTIVVRKAVAGERLTTLDGVERELSPQMLVICDAEKPVAVAGVMGGENSEVRAETVDVLLESACFDPVSIRRTSRNLRLSTDASYRFERGVDPQLAPRAMARAVQLLTEIAGGELVAGGYDLGVETGTPEPIQLRIQRVNDLIGTHCTLQQVADLLAAIEIPSEPLDDQTLQVVPPSFRVDLEREVDLIEEVTRLIGYNEIPAAMPRVALSFPDQDAHRSLQRQLKEGLCGQGFYEAINYSFVAAAHYDQLGLAADDRRRSVVQLLNPIAENQAVMRSMLLPGLLENVSHNLNHQQLDLRLFEVGKVFYPGRNPQPIEELRLGAVMTGKRYPNGPVLHFGDQKVDFYDLKGAVTQLLEGLRRGPVAFPAAEVSESFADPACSLAVTVAGRQVGTMGRVRREVCKRFVIRQEVFYLDLNVSALVELAPQLPKFTALPKYQAVNWDIAVIVPQQVAGGALCDFIRGLHEPLVEDVFLFDIYQGDPIAKGYKSVGITVRYRSDQGTLEDAVVEKIHDTIIQRTLTRFKGTLREE